MKADATLVNAAFALGRSYVPADYSSIFEKQYEGIIAANATKAKMYGDIAMAASKTLGGDAIAYGKYKGLQKGIDKESLGASPEKPFEYDKRAKADEEQQKWLDANTGDDEDITGEGYLAGVTPGAGYYNQMGGGFGEAPLTLESTDADAPIVLEGSEAYPAAGEGEFVIDDQINTMSSDFLVGAMNGLDAHFKNGGTFGDSQFDAAEGEYIRLKAELETISNKLFPSKEDKRNRNKLRKEATALRSTLNNSVANIKAKAELFANDEIYLAGLNKDITINGVNHLGPDLSILIGQIFDPTTTKSDQVEFFFENGQKMIKYAPGRAGIAYNKAKGTKGKKIPKSQWKTISENQLLNQVQPKDKDTNIAMNAKITLTGENAVEVVKGTKTPVITNFDEIKDRVHRDNVDVLSGKNVNLTYAATEDQLVGNTTRNFSKDYLKNYKLDTVINNTFGIGSDIITMADINGDKVINELDTIEAEKRGELNKHNAAKNAFIKELTNPKTQAEKKLLINELAEYWTEHNRTVFNDRRGKMGSDTKDPAWKQLGFSDYGKYADWLNKDPNAETPYKNKKVEDMVNPQTNKKFTMWSDDIIKLQNRLSNVMKSGKINQIIPVRDQMYHWGGAKLGWRKVEKKEDGKFYFIDDDGNKMKESKGRSYLTLQKVFDEQGILFQGSSGTSKTAADYINQ